MKVVCIIQARMGSSRLPGKTLKILGDKTVLANVVGRIQKCKQIDDIVVATPDREICGEAIKCGVNFFLGDEKNVLERYYKTAKMYWADKIVRITADCPYIMPDIVDELIEKTDGYGSNVINRTYPKGLDCEVFTSNQLEEAYRNTQCKYDTEHVTPYIIKHAKNKYSLEDSEDHSHIRLTLDTQQDYEDLTNLYKHIGNIYNYTQVRELLC